MFVCCCRYTKLWDTETGQCISRHSTGKVPFCVKIFPEAAGSNEVLIGQQNKLVVQLDVRSNEIVQTYNEHLGAVNSVTFLDGNRRFVSTSDDKKALVWEYGIPVVIKHIAEPDMHSMPYVAVHPSGKFFVGQSQDNQILCFTAINKYKLKRDKRFIGHLTAGYACEIGFSPDGNYIMSGDAQGRVIFWDWSTGKVYKKLKCHDQVTIGCQVAIECTRARAWAGRAGRAGRADGRARTRTAARVQFSFSLLFLCALTEFSMTLCQFQWNPIETSKMATCSWDGTIKYWD